MDLSNLIKILPSLQNLGSIESFIKLLGENKNAVSDLIWAINAIKNGEITLSELLPAFLPLILQFLSNSDGEKKENATSDNEIAFSKPLGIEPIKTVCDEKALESLASYLESVTAS